MSNARPISDLRNCANEISEDCRQTREPVFIPRSGAGDMAVLSAEEDDCRMALFDLYGKLAAAEKEIDSGAVGEDFQTAASLLREQVHGKPQL